MASNYRAAMSADRDTRTAAPANATRFWFQFCRPRWFDPPDSGDEDDEPDFRLVNFGIDDMPAHLDSMVMVRLAAQTLYQARVEAQRLWHEAVAAGPPMESYPVVGGNGGICM
jgi:hypothetical protein